MAVMVDDGAAAGGDAGAGAGGAGAAGSAADLLGGAGAGADDAAAAAAAGGGAAGGDGGAGAAAAGTDVGGGADPDWYGQLPAETGEGDSASLRDWAKATGIKDIAGLAKIARDNQVALRESGRIKVPGEGAKPEEIAAFRAAIGVPEKADGYVIAAPKDADGQDIPLNTPLIERLAGKALEAGLPKAGFEAVVQDFIQSQIEDQAAADKQQQADAEAVAKGWGSERAAKLEAITSAATTLGLSRDDLLSLRGALGAEKSMSMLARIGQGMAEDVLLTGGSGKFGITAEAAQAEIDKLKLDTAFQAKVMVKGSPEYLRWQRLQDAVGAAANARAQAA